MTETDRNSETDRNKPKHVSICFGRSQVARNSETARVPYLVRKPPRDAAVSLLFRASCFAIFCGAFNQKLCMIRCNQKW